MKHKVATTINGRGRQDEVEARLLLVHYIRDVAGLTGTHVGCDTSQCGACTVIIDGKAVKSCTMFAVQAEGRQIMTIEGLADGDKLHPIQQAFWDEHGLQCGYCTPGFIMAAAYLLEQNPNPTEDEIRRGLEGNLCRCTGYVNIVKSVQAAAKTMAGPQVKSTERASAAANLIDVDYEVLPAVMDLDAALKGDSPKAHSGAPDNVGWDLTYIPEDPAAMKGADVVVKQRILQQRLAPTPMEPRGVLA